MHKDSLLAALEEVLCPGDTAATDADADTGAGADAEADAEADAAVCGGEGGRRSILWKPSAALLARDGWSASSPSSSSSSPSSPSSSSSSRTAGSEEREETEAEAPAGILSTIREYDCLYKIQPQFGQKTGFYCDQRDNRQLIRRLSRGRSVLDMYCYSAGFSINAMKGAASSVTAVDSSAAALDLAKKNIILNNMMSVQSTASDTSSSGSSGGDGSGSSGIKLIRSDAIAFMKAAVATGTSYDVVICDPPKLAPTKKSLDRATGTYTLINALAMQLVRPGGLLLTCTCSGAMTQDQNFHKILLQAAKNAKRCV